MFIVSRKDEIFYDLFVEMSEFACLAAVKLNDLIDNFVDVDEKVAEIKTIEHECDQVFHRIMQQLNKSFVTPIDREDINVIARQLDTITDTIEDTAHSFRMFNITCIKEEAKVLSDLSVKCTAELNTLMIELKHMKTSQLITPKVIEVNRLENEGDDIYRSAMTTLFSEGGDALEVLKWKQIYEFLEDSLDACEEVANTVEGVVMKNV
jgi:Phosphate transport regulator (distant homolog of PhoU)